jgi:hypothetical protein
MSSPAHMGRIECIGGTIEQAIGVANIIGLHA